jgi:hypothetical protein
MKRVILVCAFAAGCAQLPLSSADGQLASQDGKHVRVEGIPVFSSLAPELLSLCPSVSVSPQSGGCIDILAPSEQVAALRSSAASCAEASGTFHAFGSERVGTGNFRSQTGYIEQASVSPCHGR